jgi:ubiquinone/menaquinone biosynthesis C-methylase UbiE
MTLADKMKFKMMCLVHESLYGLFRDAYKTLGAAGLRAGQQILEVGCGPGFFTIPAAKIVGEGGSILALDINPLAVAHVQKKIETEGVTNARTVLANAARTNLPDQSFDLVFVFGFFRAVGGLETIWPELHRVLKGGGVLSVEGGLVPPSELFQAVKRQGRISQFRKI